MEAVGARAADILQEPGEWLIREGEEPRFFVNLEGELEVLKVHEYLALAQAADR
jgi:hypothetical protein